MACRVGITTDPDRRKEEWKLEYPNLQGWEIIGKHRTKSAAQAQEDREAEERGCVSSQGGADADGATWFVYYFRY